MVPRGCASLSQYSHFAGRQQIGFIGRSANAETAGGEKGGARFDYGGTVNPQYKLYVLIFWRHS